MLSISRLVVELQQPTGIGNCCNRTATEPDRAVSAAEVAEALRIAVNIGFGAQRKARMNTNSEDSGWGRVTFRPCCIRVCPDKIIAAAAPPP